MDLHQEFRKLTFDIYKMKNKLMSLLLEIYEQEIHKKYDCETIYQYAFKYAKLSRETVNLALRTLKNTENKPNLRSKIATEGLYKVAMVAKLATVQNEKIYAEHVESMSKPALFEFAKELRNQKNENSQKCQAVSPKVTIELDEEMQILFNKFKQQDGKNLSNQETLRIILKKVSEQPIPKNVPGNAQKPQQIGKTDFPSRNIPAAKKREIQQKTNGTCEYPGCTKIIENYHHRIPFSFNRSHDSVVGLCKIHHEFCHNGIIKHELKEPEKWILSLNSAKSIFDQFALKYRSD